MSYYLNVVKVLNHYMIYVTDDALVLKSRRVRVLELCLSIRGTLRIRQSLFDWLG